MQRETDTKGGNLLWLFDLKEEVVVRLHPISPCSASNSHA